MGRDPFEHRKYHALYFILGVLIAVVLVLMMGCEKGKTDKGRDCIGFAGMTVEGEQCEVIVYPPPTDPPGCWYPGNTEYCEPEPPVYCCMALIPSCEACQEGLSEDEWLEKTCGDLAIDAEYAGWDEDKNEPLWLCQAVIIN